MVRSLLHSGLHVDEAVQRGNRQAGNGVLVHECSGLRFRKSGGERKFEGLGQAKLFGIYFGSFGLEALTLACEPREA